MNTSRVSPKHKGKSNSIQSSGISRHKNDDTKPRRLPSAGSKHPGHWLRLVKKIIFYQIKNNEKILHEREELLKKQEELLKKQEELLHEREQLTSEHQELLENNNNLIATSTDQLVKIQALEK